MPKYWVKLTQLPYTSSKFYSVCHVADGLLLTGAGYCYFYNMVGQRWDLLGSLLTPRFRHGSVAVGDVVYILGGTDDDVGTLESVERLDKVRLCRPLFVADMPQPVTHPMAVSYVEGLYVFGGIDADNATSRCSRYYDVKCDTWRTVAEMPEECRLGAAVAGIDCIYVVGGSTRSCLLFNPATDSWTRLCPPLNAHGNAPAVGWNNRILLAGGDDDEVTSAVEQYDTVKDEWSVWEPPLMQRLSCHFLFNIVSNTTSSADGLSVKQRDCFRGDAYRIL
ncbi:hypothetical protein LSAT2_027060 [Lamellibrachia satsuma]|nr:hypothetical protein LSAT2_027060 [Lamellibrachia satsuma]